MALATYSDLVASVGSWLNRSDLAALIPDFVTLTEEKLNRAIRVRQMETALTSTAIDADGSIAVPDGTVGVKTLWVVGHETTPLLSRSYDSLLKDGTTGVPTGWAWQGSYFFFDGSGDVAGVLYESIPSVASGGTNWLLTAHPGAYLYGTLAEAFDYTRNDKERDRWMAKFMQTVNDINGADMRDRFSGPLQMRFR